MGKLKIRLSEDACGNVTLTPVCKRQARRIATDNAYDGRADVFIQEAHADQLTDTLPRSAFLPGRDRFGCKRFNDGAVFLMDVWTFRHMVGGCND
jgi:hypothetical protein